MWWRIRAFRVISISDIRENKFYKEKLFGKRKGKEVSRKCGKHIHSYLGFQNKMLSRFVWAFISNLLQIISFRNSERKLWTSICKLYWFREFFIFWTAFEFWSKKCDIWRIDDYWNWNSWWILSLNVIMKVKGKKDLYQTSWQLHDTICWRGYKNWEK